MAEGRIGSWEICRQNMMQRCLNAAKCQSHPLHQGLRVLKSKGRPYWRLQCVYFQAENTGKIGHATFHSDIGTSPSPSRYCYSLLTVVTSGQNNVRHYSLKTVFYVFYARSGRFSTLWMEQLWYAFFFSFTGFRRTIKYFLIQINGTWFRGTNSREPPWMTFESRWQVIKGYNPQKTFISFFLLLRKMEVG